MKAIAAPVSAPMATKAAAIGKIVIGPPGQIVPASVAMTMPSNPDSAPTQRITVSRGISTATKAAIRQAASTLGRMSTKSARSLNRISRNRACPSRQ